jgi:hypothetical protein
MADFVAVLRKTIDALGDNTPEMREKVYDKARATIEAKLAAINPPPPAAVVDRQRKALEDAIAVLRTDYAEADDSEDDDSLNDAFATLTGIGTPAPSAAAPVAAPATEGVKPADEPAPKPAPERPLAGDRPAASSSAVDPASDDFAPQDNAAPEASDAPDAVAVPARERSEPRASRSRTGLIAALILLLVAAGAGYAVWMNRDDLATLVGTDAEQGEQQATAPEGAETAEELNETPPEEPSAEEEEVANLPEAEEPETPPAQAEQPATDSEPEKFTQRLMSDGSEVDEGPAGGVPTVGEGTSIASVAQPDGSPSEPAEAGGNQTAAQPGEEGGEQTTSPSVAVGQRAIFYEERTSAAQGSAEAGSIVWSTVQESPGGDLPPEPAIRAEATIPGKDIQLRMTIRRNGDQTLPASHIIEMIFLTPEGFEGGAISNVSRIAFKETEQAPGNPLIGIPAKIADGFFLIALGDAPAEIEANTTLLRRQSWVDIPIVYQSGRRALLSLEKGIPGDRVFQDVLRAWDEASSG